MKYYKKLELYVSEDSASVPQEVSFSQKVTDEDVTLLKDMMDSTRTYAIGSHSVNLTQIVEGRWLFIKADQDVSISIDGGAGIVLRANKVTEMWCNFTSLDIEILTADTRVTIAVAGE